MRLARLRQADLNLLIVFAVFSEERNVSRAAERLLLSQSAVSRALQRLKRMFKDDLFVITNHGHEITPTGQRLLQELEEMLPRLDHLLNGASFDPEAEEARFRLAMTDNAASVILPLLCRDVLVKAPRISVDVVGWHRRLFDEVIQGSIDLIFSASIVEVPSPLQSEVIYKEDFVCAVDKNFPLHKEIKLSQYLLADHISVSIQGGLQTAPDKQLAERGYKRKITLRVPYFESAVRCVEGTKMIATVPRRMVDGKDYGPSIRFIKPPASIGRFDYVMTWHPRLNTDAAHTWLRETMLAIGRAIP